MKSRLVRITTILILAIFCNLLLYPASAHGGRTDIEGGHYNYSTGEYHYHHGYSAHQHPNGICPYSLKVKIRAFIILAIIAIICFFIYKFIKIKILNHPTIYKNLRNIIIPTAIAISIIIFVYLQSKYSKMILVLFGQDIIDLRLLFLLISVILGLTEIILLFTKPSSINNCNSTASNIHNDKNKSAAENEDTAKALYTIKKAQESGGNYKWIAKNIAITYYEMKKSLSHLPLTSRQLLFATALSGSASYLKSGELTVQDISDAVEYAENGYISLGCCFIRCEKLCGSYQSEELIYLTMQLEALFFGVDCNIDEENIVYSVLGQQSSIADTVEQTLNEGEKCDIYPEIRSNVYSHTCKEEFISKVLNFKGHIYDNGHIY